jgi:hypothetical protein
MYQKCEKNMATLRTQMGRELDKIKGERDKAKEEAKQWEQKAEALDKLIKK